MEINDLSKYLSGNRNVQVFEGLDGYVYPMLLRISSRPKTIKQIVNAELVAKFHKRTNDFVRKFIARRAELGIHFKNLIRQEDVRFPIELTDPSVLKETKTLPKGFDLDSVVAVFGDTVTFTRLDEKDCFGLVLTDSVIARTIESLFDTLWDLGKKV